MTRTVQMTTEQEPVTAPAPLDGPSQPSAVLVLAFGVAPDTPPQVRALLLASLMVARRAMLDAAHDVFAKALRSGVANDPFVADGDEISASVIMQGVLNLDADDRRAAAAVAARIGGRKRSASAVNLGVPQ